METFKHIQKKIATMLLFSFMFGAVLLPAFSITSVFAQEHPASKEFTNRKG